MKCHKYGPSQQIYYEKDSLRIGTHTHTQSETVALQAGAISEAMTADSPCEDHFISMLGIAGTTFWKVPVRLF